MKKLCAIFLAALMLLTILPMAAFAKVGNDDKIINEIINGEFPHITYTKDDNKYFNTYVGLMTAIDVTKWVGGLDGSNEKKAAETILLGLIDRIEAELNNETYEKILSVLKGASDAAGLIDKVDSVTGILNLAENSAWGTSLTVLNNAVKIMNFANDEYEKYAQAYAVILSCQAASSYYGDFLQYLIDNCTSKETKGIKEAAIELKDNITMSLDQASDKLLAELAKDAAGEGALIAADFAMSTNSVTAIIKTVYSVGTKLGDKLFNTTDCYTYMLGLSTVTKIEEIVPTYIKNEIKSQDEYSAEFAKIAMLTLRETGETMLSNLGTVIAESVGGQLFKKADEAAALAETGALNATKLGVYRDIILADGDYTTYDVWVDATPNKHLIVRNASNAPIATLSNGKVSKLIDSNGAFYSVKNENTNKIIRVIVTFVPNCKYELGKVNTPSTPTTKTGGGFFAQLFAAIAAFFRSLFSFGK